MAVGSEKDRENKRLGKAGERKACAYLKRPLHRQERSVPEQDGAPVFSSCEKKRTDTGAV